MVEKAYPHLLGFNCGYDHERQALFTPATSTCEINLYGIFKKDANIGINLEGSAGAYLMWKSKDACQPLKIEDCAPISDNVNPVVHSLININDYMLTFDTTEKKLLATKMLSEVSRYWVEDNWYKEQEAYIKTKALDNVAIDMLETDIEELDYTEEDDSFDDESDTYLDMSDISEEDLSRVMEILKTLNPNIKIIE